MTGDDKHFKMNNLKHNKSIIDPESGDSQLSTIKMRCRKSYFVYTIFTLLLFVIAVVKLTGFGYGSNNIMPSRAYLKTPSNQTILCDTEDCIRSGKLLSRTMDKSIDPCEDFYEFTCGNYLKTHKIPDKLHKTNIFMKVDEDIHAYIKDVMEKDSDNNEPDSIIKLRQLYRSCTATDKMNDLGLNPLIILLHRINLPLRTGSNLWSSIAQINSFTNLNYLLTISIQNEMNNTSAPRITISKPINEPSLLSTYTLTESITRMNSKKIKRELPIEDELFKSRLEFFIAVWEEFYKYTPNYPKPSFDEYKKKYILIESVEKKFQEILTNAESNDPNTKLMYIEDLQTITDYYTSLMPYNSIFDWNDYIITQFDEVKNVIIDFETDLIQIENIEYLGAILKMLTSFPANVIGEHVLWKVITTFLPHTTDYMRSLMYKTYPDSEMYSSRSVYCAHIVNGMMGLAVTYALNDIDFVEQRKIMLIEMMENIHVAFEKIVNELKWMDDESKSKTLYKARKMKEIIGYPDIVLDTDFLDTFYSDFEVFEDDYFGNIIRYKQRDLYHSLENLRGDEFASIWSVKPYEVNAFNCISDNTIIVPVGILQYPIFGHSLQVINYGALGSILGHELTHGFDNNGRLFDADGNINMWWTETTEQNFENLTKCFIHHYESYLMPGTEKKVDGEMTLDENIADNGGLREAFWAYRKFVTENGEENKLPGLEDFSNEQIFFLVYANNWCEKAINDFYLSNSKDVHSPKSVRVTASLINSEEFSQVWKCKKGTKMNPNKEKCRIW